MRENRSCHPKLPNQKWPGSDGFSAEFYLNVQEKLISILPNVFHIIGTEESLPNSFYEAIVILIPKPEKRLNQERELQTNLTHEYGCKNSQ